jgi:hypothetical protein
LSVFLYIKYCRSICPYGNGQNVLAAHLCRYGCGGVNGAGGCAASGPAVGLIAVLIAVLLTVQVAVPMAVLLAMLFAELLSVLLAVLLAVLYHN